MDYKTLLYPKEAPSIKLFVQQDFQKDVFLKYNLVDLNSEVFCLQFSQYEEILASGCNDGIIRFWEQNTGSLIDAQQTSDRGFPVNCLQWIEQNDRMHILSVCVDGSIFYYDVKNRKQIKKIYEKDNQTHSLAVQQNFKKFATAGTDNKIRIYDFETFELCQTLFYCQNRTDHYNKFFQLIWLDETLVSGGSDKIINFWELNNQFPVSNILGHNLCGESLDFQDNQILVGSHQMENYLCLYDRQTKKLNSSIPWNKINKRWQGQNIFCAKFFSKISNLFIAGCAGVCQVKIFDQNQNFNEKVCLNLGNQTPFSISISKSNQSIAIGTNSGNIYVLGMNDIVNEIIKEEIQTQNQSQIDQNNDQQNKIQKEVNDQNIIVNNNQENQQKNQEQQPNQENNQQIQENNQQIQENNQQIQENKLEMNQNQKESIIDNFQQSSPIITNIDIETIQEEKLRNFKF